MVLHDWQKNSMQPCTTLCYYYQAVDHLNIIKWPKPNFKYCKKLWLPLHKNYVPLIIWWVKLWVNTGYYSYIESPICKVNQECEVESLSADNQTAAGTRDMVVNCNFIFYSTLLFWFSLVTALNMPAVSQFNSLILERAWPVSVCLTEDIARATEDSP